jgi:hypothetical protein
VFVTSAGSLHGQFQRAIERGNLLQALALGRELPRLSLDSALALLLLIAEQDPDRFRLAAPRWHARLVLEAKTLDLAESQLALAAVALLETELRQTGHALLAGLAHRHGIRLSKPR